MKIDKSLMLRAFNVDSELAEPARDEIIEMNDLEAFYECVDHARKNADLVNLEFWLVEISTSRKSVEVIANSLVELTLEVLSPQNRLNEALVYLRYVQGSVFGDLHKQISELILQFDSAVLNDRSLVYSENWRNYDLTKRLETGHDQQHYYDRFIAYFHEINDEKMSQRVDEFKVDFLPRIMGYFIGLSESLEKMGVRRDTAVKAFIDFLKLAYPSFRPGLLKVGSAHEDSPTPVTPVPKAESVSTKQKGYGISKS